MQILLANSRSHGGNISTKFTSVEHMAKFEDHLAIRSTDVADFEPELRNVCYC